MTTRRTPWTSFAKAAAALLLTLTAGCVSASGPRDTAGWLEARGADFMDMFGVRLGFGAGLGAYVRVTEYAQLGFMMRGPDQRELPKPEDTNLRSVPCLMVGTIGRYGGAWFDATRELMVPGWSSRDRDGLYIDREVIAGYVSPHGRLDNWRGSVGGGVHLLLIGAAAEVNPYEIFDFLGGLVGYDPSGDDVPVGSAELEEESEAEGES